MLRISRVVLSTVLCAGMAFAGAASAQSWAGGPEQEKSIHALYEKARAAGESQVVVYGAYAVTFRPLWDLFSKRFPGIAVGGTPISGSALLGKIDAEVRSGQRAGDIMMTAGSDLVTAADMGRTEVFLPPNAKQALDPEYLDPHNRFVLNYAGLVGVLYNLDKVKDVPKSLKDLLDPRYKGMVVDDPFGGGLTTISWVQFLANGLIDGAWMKAIKPNLTIVPTTAPYFANVSTGSISMLPFNSFNRYMNLKEKGARVGFVSTPGLIAPSINGMAIIKGAPHPRASELLMAWFLTPEAQNAIAPAASSYPLIHGAKVPDDWPVLKDVVAVVKPVLPADYKAARAKYEQVAREALK